MPYGHTQPATLALLRTMLVPVSPFSTSLQAVRLMRVAMQQSSIDPRTGQIDMDVIQTGVSAADRGLRWVGWSTALA
jgi:hypothetical protein